MRIIPGTILPLVAALLAAGSRPAAAAGRTSLTIGDGWAAVHEERSINFTSLEQVVVLDGVPAEADPSSLMVWADRFPVRLLTWSLEREAQVDDLPGEAEAMMWKPNALAPVPVPGSLACRLAADTLGERTVDLAYVTTGISWRVNYSVLVRGDLSKEQERTSADLDGNLLVANQTAKSFSDVLLRVVGADTESAAPVPPAPGFLLMDDSPLADLWKKKIPPVPVSYLYAVPSRARLPAHAETEINFVTSPRKPAGRLYRMRAVDYPLTEHGQAKPLHRLITLEHEPSSGLALPAGPARVFVGSFRSTLSQQAWFSHTPARGTFRIDLGPADEVVGARSYLGRYALAAGYYDDNYSISIENRLASPVAVEIEEEPGTALQWEIASATASYEVRGRRVFFTTEIPSKSRAEVTYTVRVRKPAL